MTTSSPGRDQPIAEILHLPGGQDSRPVLRPGAAHPGTGQTGIPKYRGLDRLPLSIQKDRAQAKRGCTTSLPEGMPASSPIMPTTLT